MKARFETKNLIRESILILVCWTAILFLANRGVFATEPFSLRSPKPDGLPVHVTARLDVGGHLTLATDKKNEPTPMSVTAQFAYDEQRLDDGSTPEHRLSIRLYDETQAVIKIANQTTKPELRKDRRLIATVSGKDQLYLASPLGPLSREELDLIDIPANTLVLDELLPQAEVKVGHRWKPSGDALARFLCLDAVGRSEVECVFVDARGGIAEITIDGALGGAIDGVATEIELKGKLLFDTARSRHNSLLLAIKEKHGISHVSPGLDIVAKLKLTMTPQPDSKLLSSDVMKGTKLPQSDVPPPLEYHSPAKGYRFLYDRHWHITREEPDLLVMRLVDRGDFVAQCNIAPATKPIDKPVELADFQTDVQNTLGKMFVKFERATERSTPSGLRLLHTIAVGEANDLPIQWRYNLAHDRQGRALSVVFTMEAPFAERFGDQDKSIIDSVELMEPQLASGKPASNLQTK